MKNFFLRILTGSVYVALIVAGIQVNQYVFVCVFSIFLVLCLNEFYGLLHSQKKEKINSIYNCTGGLILFLSTYLYASGTLSSLVFIFYLLYVVVLLISELYLKQPDPLTHIAYIFLSQVYIALPFSLLNFIAFRTVFTSPYVSVYYPVFLLALFVFIWVNDTGAYLTGVWLGKHRLFPRISPKKSWEGFFGGLVLTVTSSFVFAHFEPEISWYHWISISVLVVIFGTWGDLVESLFKRTLEIKDSGRTLPGHGGFLDRLDSLLLAVYAVFFYVQLFIQN
jgi:phosphatidate cytidylyltransferase